MSQIPGDAAGEARAGAGRSQPVTKRPYVPPGITFREPLETLAVVCTTGPGNPGKAIAGVGGCIIATS